MEEYEALRRLSARTKVPQQVYLREGLRYVLQKMAMQAAGAGAARRPEPQYTKIYEPCA
jgi:hypothetical protein